MRTLIGSPEPDPKRTHVVYMTGATGTVTAPGWVLINGQPAVGMTVSFGGVVISRQAQPEQ